MQVRWWKVAKLLVNLGSKFAKLCRDCGILDTKINSTDCDICFNKIKDKSERKINFNQFQEWLKFVALKKFPSKSPLEGFITLVDVIIKNGSPNVASKVTPSKTDAITARLTDPTNFTGTQRLSIGSSSPSLSKRGYNTVATASTDRLGICHIILRLSSLKT